MSPSTCPRFSTASKITVASFHSFRYCGQVSSRIDDVRPVAELLAEMWGGARAALAAGEARLGGA